MKLKNLHYDSECTSLLDINHKQNLTDDHLDEVTLDLNILERGVSQEMFFLNDRVFAVQMEMWKGVHESTKPFAFYRVPDCSRICVLDMVDFELVFNTSSNFCRNKFPSGIFDKKTNKLYPVEIPTLLHLGASNATIFEEDMMTEGVKDLFTDEKVLYNLGIPTPALPCPAALRPRARRSTTASRGSR